MSLATLFILCRFLHFMAVMLMFGITVFTAFLAPDRFSLILKKRLSPLLVSSTLLGLISAVGILAIQAGMMGGWLGRHLPTDCLVGRLRDAIWSGMAMAHWLVHLEYVDRVVG